MIRFATSAAALAMLAVPVLADAQSTLDYTSMVRTRDLTDSDIYTTNEAHDEAAWTGVTYDAVGAGWNEIGEVEDVILNRDGTLAGIVAEVGGFLDIADKHVFLPMSDVRIVPGGEEGEYDFVTRWNEEQLEQLEGVDQGWWR